MAKQDKERELEQLSTADNIRLISGFVLMLIGAFLFSSIVSYIFYWAEDMSAIAEIGVPMANPEFHNICGQGGALVAHRLVGGGFGLFSVVISFIFLVFGWRLFRYQPLRLYRYLMIFSLVLVLGSLTMGYIFGTAWGVFGSGLGGDYGIALDIWLGDMIGGMGTLLVILAGWIMTGLLINRNSDGTIFTRQGIVIQFSCRFGFAKPFFLQFIQRSVFFRRTDKGIHLFTQLR